MRVLFALLVLLALSVHVTQCFHAMFRRRLGRHGMMGTPSVDKRNEPKEQWLEQKLDHFDDGDARTWQQRYWVNDTFWDREKGPVFLMISGESEASPAWVVSGNMMINAKKYHALAVMLEHRFYGQSRPTPDLSVSSLKYLTSQQALADLATFLHHIVQQYNMTNNNKWISFGGSYSGALSAWFRIKYPDLVVGAVASSAPVEAEYDFYQYLEVVEQSLRTADNGDACVDAIKNASIALDTLLIDPVTWPTVEKLFNISPPMQFIEDAKLLSESVTGLFMETVQYNQPRRAHSHIDSGITNLCKVMTNTSFGEPLNRLATIGKLLDVFSSPLTINFTAQIEELRNTSWSSRVAMTERPWFYQTCREFAYFQASSSNFQPFGKLITLDLSDIMCRDVFGIDLFTVENNVRHTNDYYGGKNISTSATNIVFPNGSIDPWHALSITGNLSDTLVAFFIQGTSHCADMLDPSPDDPKSLTDARVAISEAIGVWLSKNDRSGHFYREL